MVHEELLRVAAIAWIAVCVLDFLHASVENGTSDAQTLAKVEGVEPLHFRDDHHDVVGRLVIDQQFARTVADGSSCRILYALQESVGVGIALEVVAHQLQREEAQQVNNDNEDGNATQYILPIAVLAVIFHDSSSLR